ncbi:MAG: iron-containing redox enzyme family protein [Candidatus Obscuribacterales bacterium]|nr:iron-containing redox enzyme family protein [Candidatus Obscuribacterales bacterium]
MTETKVAASKSVVDCREHLKSIAEKHSCSRHELFSVLAGHELNNRQVAALLRNYDAHASVLRRYLLSAAALMPEPVVTWVLENVRNEYGNGDYSKNHQEQLRDLVWSCGIARDEFFATKIQEGVGKFIAEASRFYRPQTASLPPKTKTAAVVAGAISATEMLAVKEFAALQKAFYSRGLQHHIWFDHVGIEVEHLDESLSLALYFTEQESGRAAVEYGLKGVLDANLHLYDGLLAAIRQYNVID